MCAFDVGLTAVLVPNETVRVDETFSVVPSCRMILSPGGGAKIAGITLGKAKRTQLEEKISKE